LCQSEPPHNHLVAAVHEVPNNLVLGSSHQ
jgi:hypothetical protein